MAGALGAAVGTGALGGIEAVAAGASVVRQIDTVVNRQIDFDIAAIAHTGHLPAVQCPVDLTVRRPRPGLLVWASAVAGTGFAFWLLSTLVLLLITQGGAGVGRSQGELLSTVLFIPPFIGAFGLLAGVLVGAFAWLGEGKARFREGYIAYHVRPWWEYRELARVALDRGQDDAGRVQYNLALRRLG